MGNGLLEIGEIMLSTSQRRLDTVSQNIANATTPGFKAHRSFAAALAQNTRGAALETTANFSQGAMRVTDRPLDLAIDGAGFFQLRDGDEIVFTRAGAFERDAQGRLVDARGRALQSADRADIVVRDGQFQVLNDGIVLESGGPTAQIGLFEVNTANTEGGVYFHAGEDDVRPVLAANIRQGALESANVDMAAEMLAMMSALRAAEAGARIIQTHDDLLGQSISTFRRS